MEPTFVVVDLLINNITSADKALSMGCREWRVYV
jgi:hypothetical protein